MFKDKGQIVIILPDENIVETVVLLSKNYERPKSFVQIGIDAEDYYGIKDSKKE